MSRTYQKFAGLLGITAGLAGLAYLGLFVALKNPAALPAATPARINDVLFTQMLIQ